MMRDRRLYSPAPVLKGPQAPFSKLPVRICLISALFVFLGLMLFMRYTGSAVLCVYFWIYIAAVGAIVLLLLTAGVFGICHRVRSERARRNWAIVLGGILVMLAMSLLTVCLTLSDMYQKPIGYYDSPEGKNRIVVLRTEGEKGAYYSAYPAIGDAFYVAALESDIIQSSTGIQGVKWPTETLAEVQLKDMEGNDAVISVDFSPLYAEPEAE